MQITADLSSVQSVLDKSYNILVVSREGTNTGDETTALHILGESLGKKGKNIHLSPQSGEHKGVPARSMVLRFGYGGAKIERLQYRIREDEVELTFTPFGGLLAEDQVRVEYPPFAVDCIVAVGVQELAQFPREVAAFNFDLETITTINIDNTEQNQMWGKLNVVMKDFPLYSLLVAEILKELQYGVPSNWKQLLLVATKEQLPQVGNASPRLLRLVADLLEKDNS